MLGHRWYGKRERETTSHRHTHNNTQTHTDTLPCILPEKDLKRPIVVRRTGRASRDKNIL